MSQISRMLEWHAVRSSRPMRKSVRMWMAVSGLLLVGVLIRPDSARSQAAQNAGLQDQGPAIIRHLDGTLQFYRTVNEPIQRAGEPNDVVYRDQAIAQAVQVGKLAFQSATAEAALIGTGTTAATQESDQQQRIQAVEASNTQQIHDLEAREKVLDRQIANANSRTAGALQAQKEQVHAALELDYAIRDALNRIETSGARGATGLLSDVNRLQHSMPELEGNNKTSAPQLMTIDSALSAGVTTQGEVLLDLLETQHSLAATLQANDRLRQQAIDLRAPMLTIVRRLLQEGQQLSQQAEAALPTATKASKGHAPQPQGTPSAPAPEDLQSITKQFKALSGATVPLSEEVIVLEQSHANLNAWQASVHQEYASILHSLLLRILVMAIALGIIIGGAEAWTRATNKYVRDLRRRRQLLIVRRVVVGFLSAMVLVFGFVTRFDSLATFAGFITAGIAVGLQTILLSVAAYFFIVGRYGIRVGDRITVASVTGDVIDVGLVRFYMMELAGTGNSLNPTGRVAVFSNAVLFQAGTPLYKQLPGTGYAWHELTVRLADAADYKTVCAAIVKEVQGVYEEYRPAIERQHQTVEQWMQASIETPEIDSRLQFTGGVFQLWARFPVEIREAAEIDEKITQALLELMARDAAVKAAIVGTPSIQPSVRG
jgi:small-conductance mechanosensitive channel